YFITGPDYMTFRDRQQEINFALFNAFDKERINFAYPTQTVIIEKHAGNANFIGDRAVTSRQ
ncbi:MAG: mechanosensitive ion channel family protein, partial [Bacteroidota bacterium]|nr:mechanosensitive ion channel family protein [Bacteroidota bacterium]